MKFLSVLSLISDLCVLSVPCPAYDQHGEPDDHGHNSHDDHLNHLHHLDHDELMIIKFESKLEVVHKEVVGCTQESWRLSDQMRIATLIALNS